jgi:hypothetical protein
MDLEGGRKIKASMALSRSLSRNFPGGTDENHEDSTRTVGAPVRFLTVHYTNTTQITC